MQLSILQEQNSSEDINFFPLFDNRVKIATLLYCWSPISILENPGNFNIRS